MKNYINSKLTNDKIEINYGLFNNITLTNNVYYLLLTGEGIQERKLNFFDFDSILTCVWKQNQANKYKKEQIPDYKKLKKLIFESREKPPVYISDLYDSWRKLIHQVDNDVLAVHKMNFHSTGFKRKTDLKNYNDSKLIFRPELYSKKYLVKDLKKYRATNIAIDNILVLLYEKFRANKLNNEISHKINDKIRQLFFELSELSEDSFYDFFVNNLHTSKNTNKTGYQPVLKNIYEQLLDLSIYYAMDWMTLFSDTGKPYRALNVTLMNLPPNLPSLLVCDLQKHHLHRPLIDRLEFIFYLLSNNPNHQRIYKNAKSDQIKIAFKIYCEDILERPTYSTNKLANFVNFLDDFRFDFNGNIIGLTRRAINWHSEVYFEEFNEIDNLHEDAELPPIPLPENENIKFLFTVKDIIEEGRLMQHCVSSYIQKAIIGECYLFHIDYKGEKATAEIGYDGTILQIKGVCNIDNKACEYAYKSFKEWCDDLKSHYLNNKPFNKVLENSSSYFEEAPF